MLSNDGYVRSNRKKASREINLRDDGTATERSEELFALIYNRKRKTNHLDVVEDTITLNGDDWTFGQHKKINTNADINDFFTITSNYIDSSVKNKFVDVNVDFDTIAILTNFGSLIAIIILFWDDIVSLIKNFFKYLKTKDEKSKSEYKYCWMIVLGCIPAGLAGLLVSYFDLFENVTSTKKLFKPSLCHSLFFNFASSIVQATISNKF